MSDLFRARAAIVTLALVVALALAGCSYPNALGQRGVSTIAPATHSGSNVIPAGPWVHEVAQSATLFGANTGPVSAACAQGEVALGGGWKVATQGVHVYAAYLVGNAWEVYASHTVKSRYVTPIAVTAYVECLAHDPGAIVTQFATMTDAPANTTTYAEGLCSSGGLPIGVGFDLGPVNTALEYQEGHIVDVPFAGLLGWFAITNHDLVDHLITTYIACLANANAAFSYPAANGQPISAGMTADVQVACPPGSVVAGGGFEYAEGNLSGNLYLEHANANGWEGAVYATSGSSSVTVPPGVTAVCLQFSAPPGPPEP